jgi:2-keto-myo-inositol isomerase
MHQEVNTLLRYALNTSTIRCGALTLPEKIKIAAEAGYDGIEPWVKELDEHVEHGGSLADIGRQLGDRGLATVNLIGFFEWCAPDDEIRRKGLEEARRNFAMAAELGCPYVAAPPFGIHQMTGIDLLGVAARYAELIDIAAEYDVVPVLEFWGMATTLGKLGEALLVAAESGRAAACILADVFHMYKGSGQFHGLDLVGADTIAILHMNDYPADPPRDAIADSDRVYPGDGIAPFPQIVAALDKAGFSGIVSLELFNETYWQQDALTVAKTGLEKTKQALTT